jgi:hypothetical protein
VLSALLRTNPAHSDKRPFPVRRYFGHAGES